MDGRLIKLPAVKALTALGTTSVYRGQQRRIFPQSVPIGFGKVNPGVAWFEDEIREYIAARAAGASNDDLRALVKRQEEARKRGGA